MEVFYGNFTVTESHKYMNERMCITMNKRKYRLLSSVVLCWICLVMLISGYRYLTERWPDEIVIGEAKTEACHQKFCQHRLLHLKKQLLFQQDGGYILPCKLLGYIPFKEIKVTPADDQKFYVSGSTIGISICKQKVFLVIDTGEIQNRTGETEEPGEKYYQIEITLSHLTEKNLTKRELIDDT